ncbi:Eukaryotic translation initiation factor 2C [Podila horticola]|nr:Eukaryotic translation initiation factor 2C [Podila horticola]
MFDLDHAATRSKLCRKRTLFTMALLQLTDYVKRPQIGKLGKPVNIRSNFFEVTKLPNVTIHHYDVTISSDMPPPVNRKIFEQMMSSYGASDLNNARPVFDGRKNIFSAIPFPFESRTLDVSLCVDGVPKPNRPIPIFKLKIKKVATINLDELHRFLEGKAAMSNNCLTAIMSLDILIRHKPAMLYTTVGRSFFTPDGSQPLAGCLEVWRGFYQSARPSVGRMMINVDVSATAFFQGIPLIEFVMKILGLRSPDDFRRTSPPLNWVKVERILKQVRVTTTHREKSDRSFKVTGLTKNSANKETFKCPKTTANPHDPPEEEEIDLVTYFKKAYNRTLSFPMLPCVKVGKTIVLPMEVCKVVPGQRCQKKLDEAQTADMIKFTSQNPSARANTIKNGLKILNYDDNEILRDVGMKISSEMAVIKARVLPAPVVSYHPSSREPNFTPRDGQWNLRDKKLAQATTLGSWSVILFGTERDCPKIGLEGFIRDLIVACQEIGLNIVNKRPYMTYANPHGDIEGTLKQLYLHTGNQVKSQPQILICVLPNTGVPLYAEIKRVTDTVIGISSQCMQVKHVRAPKKQYCANIGLKINVKLGGINNHLGANVMPYVTDKPTIIIGADVSHPAPTDTHHPSIAAATARSETVADLSDMLVELLKGYYQSCGQKPARILVYRDGVSEGQFANILKTEVASLRAGCRRLDINYKPDITFVVVQKRHHARFFPMSAAAADRSGNCHPGTCVDTAIVHPFEFDFYIQSHAGLLGTSRPTHYQVLQDDHKFSADELQGLTYNLCHLYARATRAVSVVPAAYYAHLVAARARFHAKGEHFSDTMSTETAETMEHSAYAAVKGDLGKVMWFM